MASSDATKLSPTMYISKNRIENCVSVVNSSSAIPRSNSLLSLLTYKCLQREFNNTYGGCMCLYDIFTSAVT